MSVYEIKHPLVQHKLGLMREAEISTKRFRELATEVGCLLTYEATKDLPLEAKAIESWAGPIEVEQIQGKKVTVVPILRAGLGMMDGVLQLVPSAKVSVVGLYREEETLEHHHTGAVLLASDLVPLTVQLLGSASSIVQFPYPHPQFIISENVNDIYYQMQIKIIHMLSW